MGLRLECFRIDLKALRTCSVVSLKIFKKKQLCLSAEIKAFILLVFFCQFSSNSVRNGCCVPFSDAYEMLPIRDADVELISFDDKEVEPFAQKELESSQEGEVESIPQKEMESSPDREMEFIEPEEKGTYFNVFGDAFTKEDSL